MKRAFLKNELPSCNEIFIMVKNVEDQWTLREVGDIIVSTCKPVFSPHCLEMHCYQNQQLMGEKV